MRATKPQATLESNPLESSSLKSTRTPHKTDTSHNSAKIYPISQHKHHAFATKGEVRAYARVINAPKNQNRIYQSLAHQNPAHKNPICQNLPYQNPAHQSLSHANLTHENQIHQNPSLRHKPTLHKSNTLANPTSRYASRHLCSYLHTFINRHNFTRIALFYPLAHEPNITPLLKKLKKEKNKQIFLPTMQGLKLKMLPYRLPLVRNHLGIYEPRSSSFHCPKIDFVLIPSLGIDASFSRIGMGKGVYDRSFNTRSKSPYRVFVSQNLTITNTHITQSFDINANDYISYTLAIKNIKGFHNASTHNRISRFWTSCRIRRLFRL